MAQTNLKAVITAEDRASSTIKGVGGSFTKMGVAMGAVAGIANSLVTKAFDSVTDSISTAIARVDTLNNSSRTFENMGFKAEDTSKAMKNLEKSILGLPTPLDEAVRGMTMLSASYGDINTGQQVFSALNNAILGFGGTADMATNAVQQLSQLPMDGPLDAQTWNSLRNSGLTPVLVAMAKDMGISVGKMKEDFGEGTLTVKDFTDKLVKMNKEGGGGMKSLEKISKDATSGIGTGWANMQTAIARGIANIIQAIGPEKLSGAVSSLGTAFESLTNIVIHVFGFIGRNSGVFETLAIIIAALLTPAVVSYTTATILAGVKSLIAGAQMATAWLMSLGPLSLIGIAVVALTLLIVRHWGKVKGWLSGFWNWLKVSAAVAWQTVKNTFSGLVGFFGSIWSTIKSKFSSIGSSIGNAMGSAFKSVVNSILGFAERTINGFIRAINGAIGTINKIPKVNISRLNELSIPRLSQGVRDFGGGTALVGENGPERVYLPKGSSVMPHSMSGGGSVNITVQAGAYMGNKQDARKYAQMIYDSLKDVAQSNGMTLQQMIGQ